MDGLPTLKSSRAADKDEMKVIVIPAPSPTKSTSTNHPLLMDLVILKVLYGLGSFSGASSKSRTRAGCGLHLEAVPLPFSEQCIDRSYFALFDHRQCLQLRPRDGWCCPS